MSTFDLRERVAEVPSEQEEYKFTFEIALAEKVRKLRAGDDEQALADAEEELANNTYVAKMMSVPRRRRQDIYEESLEKFRADRDFLGRIDELTEFKRSNYLRIGIVAAAIVEFRDPKGNVQDDNLFDVVQFIHDKAPDQIFEGLESKSKELNAKADEQEELNKAADF